MDKSVEKVFSSENNPFAENMAPRWTDRLYVWNLELRHNPFAEDTKRALFLKRVKEFLEKLHKTVNKKKLAADAAARKARRNTIVTNWREQSAATERLREKWAEEDQLKSKPREEPKILVKGVLMPYRMVNAKDLLLYLQWHEIALRQTESQPESRAFIKENWENRDEFEPVQDDIPIDFSDDPLARDFSEYLASMHARDQIAEELIKRYRAAQDPLRHLGRQSRSFCKA